MHPADPPQPIRRARRRARFWAAPAGNARGSCISGPAEPYGARNTAVDPAHRLGGGSTGSDSERARVEKASGPDMERRPRGVSPADRAHFLVV